MRHERSEDDLRPVLVVEDCDDDFDSVLEAAMQAHVPNRMMRAADAEQAARLLAQAADGCFAFVLLDYSLPGIDGLSFLESLRRNPALAALPAVIFTTSGNPRDREAFARAGANAFHVKSVQHTECLLTLRTIFEHWLKHAPPRPVEPVA